MLEIPMTLRLYLPPLAFIIAVILSFPTQSQLDTEVNSETTKPAQSDDDPYGYFGKSSSAKSEKQRSTSLNIHRKPITEEQLEYERNYYKHYSNVLEINLEAQRWQQTVSEIIFYIVMLIVLVGLTLSCLEFWQAMRQQREVKDTELEISFNKLKITSSVIGLLILVISVSFFYLFINQVYQISYVK